MPPGSRPSRTLLFRRILGVVLVAIGGVWIAQGSGALHGSFMTGEALWTVIGIIAVLFGIALLLGVAREHRRSLHDE
ncbi:MAG: hypothetical protein QOE62_2725 [Actinomycetota bacterium]|nr:hypothetical protein [Actinomycetota bacterium]